MATTFFDTHTFIKRLTASGISIEQAEAHATALVDTMDNELVKKSDMNEFRIEMKGHFELLRWMMGFVLAGLAAALFKMFH